jgi:fructose-1,6-bisphosphatase/inositol monophosphatase family enzyme
MNELTDLSLLIRKLHQLIRDEIINACENIAIKELSKVDREGEEDTIYAIDRISEKRIFEFFEQEITTDMAVILIAEGMGDKGEVVLPSNTRPEEAKFRIIMDPIDGTRELMYQKRSAWILTGIAPNRGNHTHLGNIEFAIQTEIPLTKQHLCDTLWAFRGQGMEAQRYNRLTGDIQKITFHPSTVPTIEHGFAMISRFFPGGRDILAQVDEDIIAAVLGPAQPGKAHCFEDQYLSTGGQFYELVCGHDRFVADLRPLLENVLAKRGLTSGLCCHPYDVCTELIAREAGVIITDQNGNPLQDRLNVTGNITWIGYANADIREQLEPHLKKALVKYGLI